NILVKGGTDVTITTTNGGLSIAGGSASVSSVPTAAAGAHTVVSQASAIAEISATQNVTINLAGTGKNLALTGGNGDASINSYVCNNCSATADASVSVNGNIVSVTVADGGLSILGGSAASASVDASGTALATVKTGSLLDASQDMTLNVSGNVSVQGGVAIANGGNAFNAGVLNSSSATANASIVVGNDLTLDAGGLSVSGGTATATPGAGTNTRIAVASAAAIVNVGGIASIDANAGGVTISKGIETASPAVLPDVITVDSGVAITVGSLNLTATSTINATSASISVTSDASFDGGVTVAIDAASTLTVGGNLSIAGGSSLNVNNANYYSLGGTSLSLIAGNNLSINV
ncbi:MAG: hypothetical protein GY779_11355, partial [Gammaproteobacteria bacterium]|nr:hypothetical protein [Gammaproteobacteria bacterium]